MLIILKCPFCGKLQFVAARDEIYICEECFEWVTILPS